MVAGVASLLLSKRSDLYTDDVRRILELSCDKLPEMMGQNWTVQHGFGRLNAKKALDLLQAPNQLTHHTATNGYIYNQNDQWVKFYGMPGNAPDGWYYGTKYEIRKQINFQTMETLIGVWGNTVTTNGLRNYTGDDSREVFYAESYCEIVPGTLTNNSCVLRTYVYQVSTLGGQFWDYYPCEPSEVIFGYSILGRPVIAPVIDHFTQNPNPICKGRSGSVTAYLSQGSPAPTYTWTKLDGPASFNILNTTGNPCYVVYNNTGLLSPDDVTDALIRCTVTNAGGTDIENYIVELVNDCPACPTLAFNVGGEMTNDNPLLITSLSNPGIDVTDYYLVQNPITPIGNQINLRIHEPQIEHTWLDYAELIVTRVKADELVAVNDEGEIINYKESTRPVTVLLNGETDITEILALMDSIDISLVEGDVLTIIRNSQSPEDDGDGEVVLGGEVPIKDQESITLKATKQNDADQSIESNDGDDPPIGGLFFRPKRSVIAKSLRNVPPGNLEIEINRDLVLDYLAVVRNIRTARTRTLNMLSAVHNQQGDVKNQLSSIDQNYAEILPGESIDFNFQFDNVPAERIAYIIKTAGRYETDSTALFNKLAGFSNEEIIPTENELFDNYPNPFNPTTQIKYSVKKNGLVTLKVYDLLGKEVSSLVNEEKQPGTYTVTFDAGNLASGIYFYSIKTNNFYQMKKMLLIK